MPLFMVGWVTAELVCTINNENARWNILGISE